MPAPRTCRLVTLGCKVNQYETQFFKELLEANGYREALEGEPASLCLVNTCTVTHEADAQGRQLIRRLARQNPGAAVLVTGCLATRDPRGVAALAGVTQVIPDKARLAEELRPYGVEHVPHGITRFDGHQRAFVKVQDGCLLNCTFCIIPTVRPIVRSRLPDEILDEVRVLVDQGYPEIVLTGIHLGHYGIDLSRGRPRAEWRRLWHLMEQLANLPGDFRLRLSSLEAAEVRDDLVRVLAGHPRICPHLHLCLQSGSDRILRAMKRRYTASSFLERCRRLREALDEPAFTTDVIVGFPGETEEDFAETLRVVNKVGFCKVHVFPYSPRQGTVAATLPDRVAPPQIAERRRRLEDLERELRTAHIRRLQGRRLDVLVEGSDPERPGYVRGTSCRAIAVSFEGYAPALIRRRVPVVVTDVLGDHARGTPESTAGPIVRRSLPVLASG